MRILFFTESLRSGGKERRLLELIRYLNGKPGYELMLVLTEDEIHYKYAYDLNIKIRVLRRKYIRKDPVIFFRFYNLCKEFKPDIIHTWGSMLAFYAIPVSVLQGIPHVNGHIADAPDHLEKLNFHYLITKIGFRFSDIVLSNSQAGLRSYKVSGSKCRVIYNGLDLERFDDLPDTEEIRSLYGITTRYLVIMVASYIPGKRYDEFVNLAKTFSSKRNDVTFLAVGDTRADSREFERICKMSADLHNIKLLGKVEKIEPLIHAADVGVLFTQSEGISNSILECMASGKPVLASDAGGTREIIEDNKTGFLITDHNGSKAEEILARLLESGVLRSEVGRKARALIESRFALDVMGKNFEGLYQTLQIRSEQEI